MERQLPKNVRQIGNVSDTPKIYIEDYVDTFFLQLCDKAGEEPIGAFLIGNSQVIDGEECVFISGAVQMHELLFSGQNPVIDEDTWKNGYEDCKQFFEDGEMMGWFVAQRGQPLTLNHSMLKLHRKSFSKKNTLLILKDSEKDEECYFAYKFNDLMEIGGHYVFYEKNPCMQNYMISMRKKSGAKLSEKVEDRAAKDFRNIIKMREEHQEQKKTARMMYATSAVLILVLIVMGVSALNNFDKMRNVESTLESLSGAGQQEESLRASSDETKSVNGEVVNDESASSVANTASGQGASGTSTEDTGETGGKTAATDTPEVQEASGNAVAATTAQEEAAQGRENGSDGVYTVQEGDTLAIISKKMYGDLEHVESIASMNGLTNGNLIYIGQKLVLP